MAAPIRPKSMGEEKKFTPEYQKIASKLEYIRKKLIVAEDREKSELLRRRETLRKELIKTPCKSQTDKKLKYVRYADDFLIGVNGNKEDCARIKRQLSGLTYHFFIKQKRHDFILKWHTEFYHTIQSPFGTASRPSVLDLAVASDPHIIT